MGFLPKKGNASVKSMQKVYKLENFKDMNCGPDFKINGVNTIAYLGRLELYLPEDKWHNSNLRTKTVFT